MAELQLREKLIEKALRLKALADGGIDGEKENAKVKLSEFLKKNNLEMDDLNVNRNNRSFKVNNEDDNLILTNIILSVNPFTIIKYGTKVNKKTNKICFVLMVELDQEDFIEVKNKFRYFVKLWREEKQALLNAFFAINQEYFQPDEYVRNKFRHKQSNINPDLQKAITKTEEINNSINNETIDREKIINSQIKFNQLMKYLKPAKYITTR